jgi:hypothetical protein
VVPINDLSRCTTQAPNGANAVHFETLTLSGTAPVVVGSEAEAPTANQVIRFDPLPLQANPPSEVPLLPSVPVRYLSVAGTDHSSQPGDAATLPRSAVLVGLVIRLTIAESPPSPRPAKSRNSLGSPRL